MLAVGGNVEAARRSGINVRNIYVSAFMLCSLMACVGGILAAGRLASATLSSGTGDVNLNAIAAAVIGGTSLFGGRGSAFSALIGVLVIESIASGLTLLDLNSSSALLSPGWCWRSQWRSTPWLASHAPATDGHSLAVHPA
jgi:D-xylose transport system permease protein